MFGFYQPQKLLKSLTPAERERIWKSAFGETGVRWQALITALCAGLCAFLAILLAPTVGGGLLGYHLRGIIVAIAAAGGAYFGEKISAFSAKRRLRHELAAMGRCPNCGRDLSETPGRCPKCGEVRPAPDSRTSLPK